MDGGGLASPALRKACCVCGLLSLFRASAQAKVPDPAARERLHPTGSGQARYVTDDDPIAKGAKDLGSAYDKTILFPLELAAKGWVRNADANIEGDSTTAASNNSNPHDAEDARRERKNRPNNWAQNLRFRIVMSTSCLLALQGSTTLLLGLGLPPSAGRHAFVPVLALVFLTKGLGEQGSCRGKTKNDLGSAWSGP